MKKVIFFSKNLEIGGMEKALINLLNRLVQEYDVTLVLEEKKGILLNLVDNRIEILEYKLATDKFVLLRKIKNFLHRKLWSLKNKNKYAFSCNYATYSLLGSRLAQVASENSALYVHNNYYDMLGGNHKEIEIFFSNHYANKFDKIIFVSNESAKQIVEVLPALRSSSLVINNLIDYETILKNAQEEVKKHVFKKENTNILYVGRIDDKQKDFKLMIEAFSRAVQVNKKLKLYIMGDGPDKDNLSNIIASTKLTNEVVLLGQMKNPYPFIKNCDCLLFTSRFEGFPVTYYEALILNQKFITTIAVSDAFVDVRDYFTIVKRDPDDIARQLIKVTKDKRDYKMDFKKINDRNFEEIKRVIEK